MTVTRDVVLDLLPLYFAGEVSADTRTLVEEFLRTDPDFARMSQRFDTLLKQHDRPDPDPVERRAFERTRMLVRYRNQCIGVAIGFSLFPFAFTVGRDGVKWMLMREQPVIAIAWGLTGLACWIAAYVIGRRARSTVA
jgi:hypothetical protein